MNNMYKKKAPLCLYETTDGIPCIASSYGGSRGLCTNHYVRWRSRLKTGKTPRPVLFNGLGGPVEQEEGGFYTTWEQLEEDGKCKKKLTQAEKNIAQMHPHRSYKKKTPVDPTVDPNPEF